MSLQALAASCEPVFTMTGKEALDAQLNYMSLPILYKPFIKPWYNLILTMVPLFGTTVVKYSRLNYKSVSLVLQGLLLEPATTSGRSMFLTPCRGKHWMQIRFHMYKILNSYAAPYLKESIFLEHL